MTYKSFLRALTSQMRHPPSSAPFTDSTFSGSLSSPFCLVFQVLLGGLTFSVRGPQGHHQSGVVTEVRRLDGSGAPRKGDFMIIFLTWCEGLRILKPSSSAIFQGKQEKTPQKQTRVVFLPNLFFLILGALVLVP